MIPPSYVDSLNNEELYSNLLDKHLSEEEKNYMFDDFTHKTDKPDFPTLGMDETKKELKKFIDSKVRSVPQNKPQQKGKDEYDGWMFQCHILFFVIFILWFIIYYIFQVPLIFVG